MYQLISTANSALIPSNKAGLAVLISWQIQNRPQDLFFSFFYFDLYFFKYETIVRSSAWSFSYSDSDPSTVRHEKGRWMFSYVDVYLVSRPKGTCFSQLWALLWMTFICHLTSMYVHFYHESVSHQVIFVLKWHFKSHKESKLELNIT